MENLEFQFQIVVLQSLFVTVLLYLAIIVCDTSQFWAVVLLNILLSIFQLQPLVPVHQFDKLPSYYIFAGLVFVPLTQPYLHEYGEDWYNTSPRRLCERALRELPKKANQQLVILSQVSIFLTLLQILHSDICYSYVCYVPLITHSNG